MWCVEEQAGSFITSLVGFHLLLHQNAVNSRGYHLHYIFHTAGLHSSALCARPLLKSWFASLWGANDTGAIVTIFNRMNILECAGNCSIVQYGETQIPSGQSDFDKA